MADDITAPPPSIRRPAGRRLPFKPTALGRTSSLQTTKSNSQAKSPGDDNDDEDNQSLDLFRRSKEVWSRVKEENSRKEQERRNSSRRIDSEVHTIDTDTDSSNTNDDSGAADDNDEYVASPHVRTPKKKPPTMSCSPQTATKRSHSSRKSTFDDYSVSSGNASSSRDMVTPSPCKRSKTTPTTDSRTTPRSRSRMTDRTPTRTRPGFGSRTNSMTASHSPTPPDPSQASKTSSSSQVIELDDSDDDVRLDKGKATESTPTDVFNYDGDVSDQATSLSDLTEPKQTDNFQKYIDQARRDRQQESNKPDPRYKTTDAPQDDKLQTAVEVYITSCVPDTKPLLLRCRLNRRHDLLSETWCAFQRSKGWRDQVPIGEDDDVFLTWRQTRVYRWTTFASLGIKPEDNEFGEFSGRLTCDSLGPDGTASQGFYNDWHQIHMEAWTSETYDAYLAAQDRRRRRARGEAIEGDDAEYEAMLLKYTTEMANPVSGSGLNLPSQPQQQQHHHPPQPEHETSSTQGEKVRVMLKPRDGDATKMTARTTSTVESLIRGYKHLKALPDTHPISLVFDGDVLEAHMTLADADVDDMDVIEVHE